MSTHIHCIDKPEPRPNNGGVLFNSGTGRENPIYTMADTAARAVFLRPFVLSCLLWRAGRGSLRAGRFHSAGILTPVRTATHREKWLAVNKPHTMEAMTMPSISRALSRLFPAVTTPISVLPSEAEARALSALLVAQGRRAVFHRTAAGFAVEVLA